jgi:acetyl esterase/lipase
MAGMWDRRGFLSTSATSLSTMAVPALSLSGASEVIKKTFTYKKIGKCELRADVHASPQGGNRPVAVWIHGGALIMGDRRGIDGRLVAELIEAGYVVVSIDYRLAPETKLSEILDDVRDAVAWIHADGPRSFGANEAYPRSASLCSKPIGVDSSDKGWAQVSVAASAMG